MPSQFKLSDILNMLSIGVLAELILFALLNYLYPGLYDKIRPSEHNQAIIIAVGLLLSLPLWRLVSNFVELIMYSSPVLTWKDVKKEKQGFIKWCCKALNYLKRLLSQFYKFVFFGIGFGQGLKKADFMMNICTGTGNLNELTQKNIKTTFKQEELSNENYVELYDLIKSFLMIQDSYGSMYSSRYNMVFNYHSRLAILSHFSTLVLIGLLFFKPGDTFVQIALLAITYFFSIHFGSMSKTYSSRASELMINDFNAFLANNDLHSNVVGIQPSISTGSPTQISNTKPEAKKVD